MRTILKDNPNAMNLITLLTLILLLGANLVGIADNRKNIKDNSKSIAYINKEFVPMMFLNGMAKNSNYQTSEIVNTTGELIAVFSGNKELAQEYRIKISDIQKKYLDFQQTMIDQMIEIKKANSTNTRSGKSEPLSENDISRIEREHETLMKSLKY